MAIEGKEVAALRQREAELRLDNRRLEVANKRMSQSLAAAAQIQRSLLPESLPEVPGVDFAWTFEPCHELAGDSLSVFNIDDRRLGLYVLDVSGHGVPAALLSVTLARVLAFSRRTLDTPGSFADPRLVASPRAVAERLNQLFPMSEQDRQYFTLFYGVLEYETGSLSYVTAGHPAPVLQRPGEGCRHLPVGGFPIGMSMEPNYVERRFDLRTGDRLFIYTDGLIEASDAEGFEFGPDRLAEEIGITRDLSLAAGVEAVAARAALWSDGNLGDDLSILALELTA